MKDAFCNQVENNPTRETLHNITCTFYSPPQINKGR